MQKVQVCHVTVWIMNVLIVLQLTMDYRSWLNHRFLEFKGLLSPLTDVHPGRTCISISQLEGRTVLLLARY